LKFEVDFGAALSRAPSAAPGSLLK
jgi:hypothetical protein